MKRKPRTLGGAFYVELISSHALRQYMSYRDSSIRKLASRIGVSPATIGHLHSGARKTVRPETAKAIEDALDAPRGSLFVPKIMHNASMAGERKVAA